MVALLSLALAIAGDPPSPAPAAFRIAGYLPDYRVADYDLNAARGITDLILFSAEPTAEGGISLSRLKNVPWAKFRAFKTRERVRLILCVGGWERSAHFAAVTATAEKRAAFTRAAMQLCLTERLDGIDLDWEHPKDAAQEANYGALLADLRAAFQPHGLSLSVTLAAWQHLPRAAFAAVDAVQVMAYDHDGQHATFAGVVADVKKVIAAGAPPGKIVLGLPFYGRHQTQRQQAPTFAEIVAKYRPPPATDEIEGIYFNGPATIRRKTEYARTTGLGGVMIWELGQDAPGPNSLLSVIRNVAGR